MPTTLPRPLPPNALTLSATLLASQRAFHSIPRRHNAHGAGTGAGGKPADSLVTEQENEPESLAFTETTGGRTRHLSSSALRSRQNRRRIASALPPVKLPRSFLTDNVSLYTPGQQPRLPFALLEDTTLSKTSRFLFSHSPSSRQFNQAVRSYFDAALALLFERSSELVQYFDKSQSVTENIRRDRIDQIERLSRLSDMVLDSAWHVVDSIYPARQAEYSYKVRPYWWWSVNRGLDCRSQHSGDPQPILSTTLREELQHAETLVYPLAHAVMDLPVDTLLALQRTVNHEFQARPPVTFDAPTCKRPITILSMSGYGGKAVAEAVAQHLAFWNQADLVHVDAQDLSALIGEYLGLNWAYARGAASMIGFRAAELNGKLARETGPSHRYNEDDENDAETGILGLRTSVGSFENELQKIRHGEYDCFSKWENLKIDKILDHIIRAPELKASHGTRSRPLLLHLHDIIELSMILEGSLLIGRLRVLVDAAWKQGTQIAIIGTSSCENLSDDYQDAVQQFAATDLVITRHLESNHVDRKALVKTQSSEHRFSLQHADYFSENIRNINRMLRALSADDASPVIDMSHDLVKACMWSTNPRFSILRDSILPIPEVYNLARAFSTREEKNPVTGADVLSERCAMGPLQRRPGQRIIDEAAEEMSAENGERHRSQEEAKSDFGATIKLNEYEKRISSGQIHRENLRTTFADVHAPQETISALKLLTSLALLRPDAFTYGVLSQDRIPGCLLYGPPGTGKTMLAKAVAKESGANMLEISGATINDKWVGESEKLIRAVFTLAKRLEPCVVFIDEADSLLANRSMFSNRASHREHINQFLKEWDGLEETNAFIMVATNRPFDLDDAVLRRLPRKILVDLPLETDRAAILRLLLRGESIDGSVSLEDLAKRTPYYSGSDLKNLCVAAAMAAVEEENEVASKHQGPEPYQYPDRRLLRQEHFESALKQIPASISEDMTSLKQIRTFDEEYGSGRRGPKRKASMGFGIMPDRTQADTNEARIRP